MSVTTNIKFKMQKEMSYYFEELKELVKEHRNDVKIYSVVCDTELSSLFLEKKDIITFAIYSEYAIEFESLKELFRTSKSDGSIIVTDANEMQRTMSRLEDGIVVKHEIEQMTIDELLPFQKLTNIGYILINVKFINKWDSSKV